MSFRGRGGGGSRGGRGNSFNRGGGGGRGRGGGGGGFGNRGKFDQGPPSHVIPFGYFDFTCQDDLVLKAEIEDVPYFNAPIFLENKSQIGKIDEIFGTLRDYSVSVKLSDNMKATSFVPKQKLFIDPAKLLPLQRFLPQPPKPKIGKKKGDKSGQAKDGNSFGGQRGGGRGGFSRGARGGGFSGRGSSGNRGGGFRGRGRGEGGGGAKRW